MFSSSKYGDSYVIKLNDRNLEKVASGQMCADSVIWVDGLWVCTGVPTDNNPEVYFWKVRNVSINKQEAMEIIRSKSTRNLNADEEFLKDYLYK